MILSESTTIVELLRARASEQGSKTAFIYLDDDGSPCGNLTYGELEIRARNIGAWLSGQVNRGERILLAYPSGLEFLEAFFGCLYAGCLPVPAYLPHPLLLKRSFPRLLAIIQDSRPALGLSSASSLQSLKKLASAMPELKKLSWEATDTIALETSGRFEGPDIGSDWPAVLQYSSGTSGKPRGVILTHANMLCNVRNICRLARHTPDTTIVSWLPHSHDMGLVTLLICLQTGGLGVLLATLAFLKEPVLWLEALSRYRGASSPAPNFAYELCVRRTTLEQRSRLDLRSWSVAINGAEPVRAGTLERFLECFAPHGFRREAFYPCYGLAESTLMVTGGRLLAGPVLLALDRKALEQGRVEPRVKTDTRASVLVGCGSPLPQHRLLVVDPESRRPCPPDRTGELWVSGPSVGLGYWDHPEETERTFRARLAGAAKGYFLRTGDIGFLREGQLFVAGRLGDLIIINGEKHHPEDLECTAQESSPLIRPNGCAAFSVPGDETERLVLAVEVDLSRCHRPDSPNNDMKTVLAQIRSAVQEAVWTAHVLPVETLLLRPGQLPRTTSGKVQRKICRSEFLARKLKLLG